MADRHTAQTVLAALTARGRTVTDASDTSARVDGVRLEFTRTRCTVAEWTNVPLGACSPRGRTVEQIDEAIFGVLERHAREEQERAAKAEINRRFALAEALSFALAETLAAPVVRVDAHDFHRMFTITVSPIAEDDVAGIAAAIRRHWEEKHA